MRIKLQSTPVDAAFQQQKKSEIAAYLKVNDRDLAYFAFDGEATNSLYNLNDESINILYKDGSLKDISQVDNPLISMKISEPVKKYYFCYLRM